MTTSTDPSKTPLDFLQMRIAIRALRFDGYSAEGNPQFSTYANDGSIVSIDRPEWFTFEVDRTSAVESVQIHLNETHARLREDNRLGVTLGIKTSVTRTVDAGQWIAWIDDANLTVLENLNELYNRSWLPDLSQAELEKLAVTWWRNP